MADFTSFLKKFDPNENNAGNILLILQVLSMVLAAACNTFAIVTDKNTTDQDRKFLVPAGLATGVANTGLYFAITKKLIKNFEAKALKRIEELKKNNLLEQETLKFVKKSIDKSEKGFLGTGLFKEKKEVVDSMKSTLLSEDLKTPTAAAVDEFSKSYKNGAGVVGAFVGAIIGGGILTPVIRDVGAYFIQKQMEKKNPEMKSMPHHQYLDPGHLKVPPFAKPPMTLNRYMAFTRNPNLKV